MSHRRILFCQPRPPKEGRTPWYSEELAAERASQLRALMSGTDVITSSELWAKNDAGFAGWVRFIFEGQRPSERITDIIVDEPWQGNATREILEGAQLGSHERIRGALERKIPVLLWSQVGELGLQPEGALNYWHLTALLDNVPLTQVPTRNPNLILHAVHSIARPSVKCGCGGCNGVKSHPVTAHGWLAGGARHDGFQVKGRKQRPFEASLGAYCVALSEEHREALEAWAPTEGTYEETDLDCGPGRDQYGSLA